MKSPVVKRSIVLAGHKTSVSLEDEFWMGLKEIAGKRLMTLSVLVDRIDTHRQQGNLSSALRLRCADQGAAVWPSTPARSAWEGSCLSASDRVTGRVARRLGCRLLLQQGRRLCRR